MSLRPRLWAPEEDAIITALSVDGAPVAPADALAALTAANYTRTTGGVIYRLQLLGLWRSSVQPWCATESEIIAATLAEHPAADLSTLAMALSRKGYHRPHATIRDHLPTHTPTPSSHRSHHAPRPPLHTLAASDAQLITRVIARTFPAWEQGACA